MLTRFIFNAKTGTIKKIICTDKELVIPSTIDGVKVLSIGKQSGKDVTSTHLKISEGIVCIDESAFANCPLQTVEFPKSLLVIGDFAFQQCQLSTLNLRMVVEVGISVFFSNQLTTITTERTDKCIRLGMLAFALNKISDAPMSAFSKFGDGTFYKNALSGSLVLQSVKLGENTFSKNKLTQVSTISIPTIPKDCFASNEIKHITIDANSIEPYAFAYNEIDIAMLHTVKIIKQGAFFGNNLKAVCLTACIEIEEQAFEANSKNIEFLFQSKKQYNTCTKSTKSNFAKPKKIVFNEDIYPTVNFGKLFSYVAKSFSVSDYSFWGPKEVEIPSFITNGINDRIVVAIGPHAFKDSDINSVVVSTLQVDILKGAFENSSVSTVTLPNIHGIKIEKEAFCDCPNLTTIKVSSRTIVDADAFKNCPNAKIEYYE